MDYKKETNMFSSRISKKTGLIGLLILGFGALSAAAWESQQTPFGTTVTNGTISFRTADAKAGKEMADALNKADKKSERAEKKEDKKDKKD